VNNICDFIRIYKFLSLIDIYLKNLNMVETEQPSAESSTKMMGTLMHIQELFYNLSSHKDGPNAGKVNKDQLKDSK